MAPLVAITLLVLSAASATGLDVGYGVDSDEVSLLQVDRSGQGLSAKRARVQVDDLDVAVNNIEFEEDAPWPDSAAGFPEANPLTGVEQLEHEREVLTNP